MYRTVRFVPRRIVGARPCRRARTPRHRSSCPGRSCDSALPAPVAGRPGLNYQGGKIESHLNPRLASSPRHTHAHCRRAARTNCCPSSGCPARGCLGSHRCASYRERRPGQRPPRTRPAQGHPQRAHSARACPAGTGCCSPSTRGRPGVPSSCAQWRSCAAAHKHRPVHRKHADVLVALAHRPLVRRVPFKPPVLTVQHSFADRVAEPSAVVLRGLSVRGALAAPRTLRVVALRCPRADRKSVRPCTTGSAGGALRVIVRGDAGGTLERLGWAGEAGPALPVRNVGARLGLQLWPQRVLVQPTLRSAGVAENVQVRLGSTPSLFKTLGGIVVVVLKNLVLAIRAGLRAGGTDAVCRAACTLFEVPRGADSRPGTVPALSVVGAFTPLRLPLIEAAGRAARCTHPVGRPVGVSAGGKLVLRPVAAEHGVARGTHSVRVAGASRRNVLVLAAHTAGVAGPVGKLRAVRNRKLVVPTHSAGVTLGILRRPFSGAVRGDIGPRGAGRTVAADRVPELSARGCHVLPFSTPGALGARPVFRGRAVSGVVGRANRVVGRVAGAHDELKHAAGAAREADAVPIDSLLRQGVVGGRSGAAAGPGLESPVATRRARAALSVPPEPVKGRTLLGNEASQGAGGGAVGADRISVVPRRTVLGNPVPARAPGITRETHPVPVHTAVPVLKLPRQALRAVVALPVPRSPTVTPELRRPLLVCALRTLLARVVGCARTQALGILGAPRYVQVTGRRAGGTHRVVELRTLPHRKAPWAGVAVQAYAVRLHPTAPILPLPFLADSAILTHAVLADVKTLSGTKRRSKLLWRTGRAVGTHPVMEESTFPKLILGANLP
eukprot:1127832-Rhodomonas_salina.1